MITNKRNSNHNDQHNTKRNKVKCIKETMNHCRITLSRVNGDATFPYHSEMCWNGKSGQESLVEAIKNINADLCEQTTKKTLLFSDINEQREIKEQATRILAEIEKAQETLELTKSFVKTICGLELSESKPAANKARNSNV